MIDLHCHSIYSDGTSSVVQLLKEAQYLKLDYFSITDHDSVGAYLELNNINVKDYYSGKIVVGCEFNCIFENQRIELLGYLFDIKNVNDFFEYYYSNDKVKKRKKDELTYFKKLCFKNNIKISDNIDFEDKMVIDALYDDIINYPINKDIIGEDAFESKTLFFRMCVGDSNFVLYKNYYDDLPSASDIAKLIHDSGGKVFLAHPYVYAISDIFAFIEKLKNIIDGIECFHSNFNSDQINKLLLYAKNNNLLISGGSDYHGTKYSFINLGKGINNNLNISKTVVLDWII